MNALTAHNFSHVQGSAYIQTDVQDRIVRVSPAAQTLTGLPLNKLLGRDFGCALPLAEQADLDCTDRRRDHFPSGVFRVLRPYSGTSRIILTAVSDVPGGRVHVLHEMDGRTSVVPTGFDLLTGLPDRRRMEGMLTDLFVCSQAESHQLLYIDLDQFKIVNDLCGHQAGDRLLEQLTVLWGRALNRHEYLGRIGGDEFCVLAERGDTAGALALADQLISITQDLRFCWNGQVFRIGASIGLVPLNAVKSAGAALSAADSTCWSAKEDGRNRVSVYDPGDPSVRDRQEQMGWLSRIVNAIDEDRLVLYQQRIQPLCESVAEPHGEILVRMVDEDGCLVAPGVFMPAAERFNLSARLDRWVIEKVLTQLETSEDRRTRWSINVSGATLSDPRFNDWIEERLARCPLLASRIGFELTETAAINSIERASRFISVCHAAGCTVSLDDFGSGVSSFAYLRELDVDYLKIDGQFIRNLTKNPVDRAMVEAISSISKVMGIATIAEFVEDDSTQDCLVDLGVQFGQGYGIHVPEPWNCVLA